MNLKHQVLESGYHHVKDVSKHHLFAQWPIGVTLTPSHVSSDGELHPEQMILFIAKAAEAAGTDNYWDGSR